MNIVAILTILVSNMLVYAAPLIFTSIGGAYSEHAGVVNVGLEGIMVMGAFTGVVFNLTFAESLGGMTIWLSLLAGGLVGLIFSAIHAVATINFRADHVVSGTVLNLLAPALAVFLVKAMEKDKLIILICPLVNLIFQFCLIFLLLEIFSLRILA